MLCFLMHCLSWQLWFVKSYLRTAGYRGKQSTEREEEEALLREVQSFCLASHFFWGVWSAVCGKLSQIPFGYWVSTFIFLLCKMLELFHLSQAVEGSHSFPAFMFLLQEWILTVHFCMFLVRVYRSWFPYLRLRRHLCSFFMCCVVETFLISVVR